MSAKEQGTSDQSNDWLSKSAFMRVFQGFRLFSVPAVWVWRKLRAASWKPM